MSNSNTPHFAVSLPDFSQAAFIAPTASVMGQVAIATGASIWYSAVVRGDVKKLKLEPIAMSRMEQYCTEIQVKLLF